jgi:hypothetical protein
MGKDPRPIQRLPHRTFPHGTELATDHADKVPGSADPLEETQIRAVWAS